MKKLFLGLAVVAGSLAFAQETKTTPTVTTVNNDKEPIRFGIKAGGNAASFNNQDVSLNNQKLGFHAGVLVNIPLSKKFAIQPEVLYNQLGSKSVVYSNEVTTGATTVKTKEDYSATLNYVSVPLMLQMRPTEKFYIEAGPEFSYFINGKNKGEKRTESTTAGVTTTTSSSVSEDIEKDDIKKFNVGLGLGLGYDFTHNFGINARYVNSLTNIDANPSKGMDALTNRVFQLGLNYKF
ncbi:porin family protein [Chryseobacterium sp. G0201]|uniref:porin family protein n=1 Tax=Chryseobacterium sp. G0201 TaxID=2487065 RepID=UPI000F4F9976|nr:porin family protein [Chryseobacterium sp. G0201]AZA54888.1 PorT family protein [Chryseobacterium sp. G0201]